MGIPVWFLGAVKQKHVVNVISRDFTASMHALLFSFTIGMTFAIYNGMVDEISRVMGRDFYTSTGKGT